MSQPGDPATILDTFDPTLESNEQMSLLAAYAAFVLGFFLLPHVVPGLEVRGPYGGARSAVISGLVSIGLGKVLLMFLSIVFFPILLLGPLAAVIAYALGNFAILMASEYVLDEIECDSMKTTAVTALILAGLEVFASRLV